MARPPPIDVSTSAGSPATEMAPENTLEKVPENALERPLPATYEAALQELEGLIAKLESGQQPLEALLSSYQRGAQLLAFCRSRLEAVETQIKVLDGTRLKPWLAA